jgi:hypothetical protein
MYEGVGGVDESWRVSRGWGIGGVGGFGSVVEARCWTLKGLLVTGSFSIRPWKVLLCLRSLFKANGRSFSASACSYIDWGRGRFSPETRRVGKAMGVTLDEGVEGVGICDLKGDLETRLLLWTWR